MISMPRGMRRMGRFTLPARLLAGGPRGELDSLYAVFDRVIVVRCEYDMAADKMEYGAWHPMFRALDDEEPVPTYVPITTRHVDGSPPPNPAGGRVTYTVEWQEVTRRPGDPLVV